MNEQQLHTVHALRSIERNQNLRHLHAPQHHQASLLQAESCQIRTSRQLGTQAGTTPLAVAQGGGMNLGGTESKILTSIGGLGFSTCNSDKMVDEMIFRCNPSHCEILRHTH
ncbi:hypothetical protein KC327_g28 [Hortaea werneckii]|nr:hypothetical protein KC327_g28 [Hortaea werneckii]